MKPYKKTNSNVEGEYKRTYNKNKKKFAPRKQTENEITGLVVMGEECNFDIERMIKKFKKKVMKSGIMVELKSRQFYEKPSDKRRRKKKESIRRIRKEEYKLNAVIGNDEDE